MRRMHKTTSEIASKNKRTASIRCGWKQGLTDLPMHSQSSVNFSARQESDLGFDSEEENPHFCEEN